MRAKPFSLVAAVFAVACATTRQVDVASVQSELNNINRRMEQAVSAKNADAIAELYANDAVFMAPNAPAARGKEAIRASWAEALKASPTLRLTTTGVNVAASGDWAGETGTYTFSYTGDQGPVTDRGKYVVNFRRDGTDWKVVNDIFNSDLPLPAPSVAVIVVEPPGDKMVMTGSAALTYQPLEIPGFKPGMQIAVVHGDPGGKGDYTIRLKFPAGYMFPAHYHPNAEHLTVLAGTFLLGMGDKEGGALHEYQPGDFLYIPGKEPHFGGAKGETVIQLHGMGPFEVKLAGVAE